MNQLYLVDMAKRVGRVGSIGFAGQLGRGSKRVNRVAGRVGLTRISQTSFFFFSITKANQ